MELIAALIIGLAATTLLLRNWRITFFAALVVAVLEGAIRKWLLAGAQQYVYFIKDYMLLLVYFVVFTTKPMIAFSPATRTIAVGFFACLAFAALQFFNPDNPSTLLYVIGVKSYFMYVPIAFVVPYLFKDMPSLLKFVRYYIYFAVPIALLGFVQLYAGPTHWLNIYVSHTGEAAAAIRFGEDQEFGRTSGTFSFIGGYTTYLAFICSLAFAYLAIFDFRVRDSRPILATFALCVGAMFTTGSRTPIATLSFVTALSIVFGILRGFIGPKTGGRILLILPVAVYIALQISPEAVSGLAHRARTADSTLMRLAGPFAQPLLVIDRTPFFGFGLGTTHNSSLVVMQTSEAWWLNGVRAEAETARVLMELGHFGFILFYGFLFASIYRSTSAIFAFRERQSSLFALIFMTFMMFMTLAPLVNNPMAGIYFWMSIGILNSFYFLKSRTDPRFGLPMVRPSTRPPASPGRAISRAGGT